jgi:archaellum component FlaG (FlaF/FlaG flagellin family)
MGFGGVSTAAIMFIAIVIMASIMATLLSSQVEEITYSAAVAQKSLSRQMKTSLSIQHAYYDTGEVHAYIKNIGDSQLKLDDFTVFINNDYFKVNGDDATGQVVADTDTVNTGILDKHEIMHITATTTLSANAQHTYILIDTYGNKYIKLFTT